MELALFVCFGTKGENQSHKPELGPGLELRPGSLSAKAGKLGLASRKITYLNNHRLLPDPQDSWLDLLAVCAPTGPSSLGPVRYLTGHILQRLVATARLQHRPPQGHKGVEKPGPGEGWTKGKAVWEICLPRMGGGRELPQEQGCQRFWDTTVLGKQGGAWLSAWKGTWRDP